MPDFLFHSLAIGIGATLVMDAWALVQAKWLGWQTLDYALVGRWIGNMPRGQFAHASIRAAEPVLGEAIIGWSAHYAIGVAFAAILLAVAGASYVDAPALWPALGVGLATIVVPFFVMQPAMGSGIAASRTPNPMLARVRAVLTHTVFGLGLWLSALALRALS